jgi:pectate lyase
MQVILRVGIFDIDDVILNAFGFMIGYWLFALLRSKRYKTFFVILIIAIVTAAFAGYSLYPKNQPVNPRRGLTSDQFKKINSGQVTDQPTGDLCGGTNGNGQIVSIGKNQFTMARKDGKNQVIHLTDQATIKTSGGSGALSDLKKGYRVTLVGGPNADGSFTADAVYVCNGAGVKTQQ